MSGFSEFSIRAPKTRGQRRPKIGMHVVFCLLIMAGTAAIFVLYHKYRDQRRLLAEWPPKVTPSEPEPRRARVSSSLTAPDLPDKPATGEPLQPIDIPLSDIDPNSPADSSPEESEPKEEPVDPARQQAFNRAVADARKAMSEHNLLKTRSYLDRAGSDAQTDDDRALTERLEFMLDHLNRFWEGTKKAIAGLKTGTEFTVNGIVIIVVEVGEDDVLVRALGENRRYPLDDLPHRMVFALAEKWFADQPASELLLGAYLAVDPKGDPARARRLWQDASAEGVDVEPLLAELEYWDSVPRVAKSVADLRDNPPDEELLKDTRRQIVEKFKEDYARANTPARKTDLAQKLLAAADKGGEPVAFLAMIHEAKNLAIASGDVAIVCQTIDILSEYGKHDPLAEKTTSLEEASKNVRGLAANRELVHRALKLMEEAIALDRAEEAKKLANLAENAAKKSKNVSLIQQAASAVDRARGLDK